MEVRLWHFFSSRIKISFFSSCQHAQVCAAYTEIDPPCDQAQHSATQHSTTPRCRHIMCISKGPDSQRASFRPKEGKKKKSLKTVLSSGAGHRDTGSMTMTAYPKALIRQQLAWLVRCVDASVLPQVRGYASPNTARVSYTRHADPRRRDELGFNVGISPRHSDTLSPFNLPARTFCSPHLLTRNMQWMKLLCAIPRRLRVGKVSAV
jgi:hypothetical protein